MIAMRADTSVGTVVVAEPIHPAGLDRLRQACHVVELPPGSDEHTLLTHAGAADALISRGYIQVTRAFLEAAAPRLKVVAVHGVGTDHVDLAAATAQGVLVFNTPAALTESVADLTVALLLALLRRVVAADQAVRAGEWDRKYTDLVGVELAGKTVGIVGLGRIGAAVAHRLRGFGVTLQYHDALRRRDVEAALGIRRVDLDTLCATSDIITLHVPFTPQTRHLISQRVFSLMKAGVYLLNLARGQIIEEAALIAALRSGKVAGAAVDVFNEEPPRRDHPLLAFKNVVVTPHLGATTQEALQKMALQAAEGVLTVFRGETPPNIVASSPE
jgi:D-3-phosphoglycerate dehydrogenase